MSSDAVYIKPEANGHDSRKRGRGAGATADKVGAAKALKLAPATSPSVATGVAIASVETYEHVSVDGGDDAAAAAAATAAAGEAGASNAQQYETVVCMPQPQAGDAGGSAAPAGSVYSHEEEAYLSPENAAMMVRVPWLFSLFAVFTGC